MVTIGIGELRKGLRKHIAAVSAGATVTGTDRGRPVARIVPVEQPTALERLIAEGVVAPPKSRGRTFPQPIQTAGTVGDLVAEQRR